MKFTVVDSGLVVDLVHHDVPFPPPSTDQPQSSSRAGPAAPTVTVARREPGAAPWPIEEPWPCTLADRGTKAPRRTGFRGSGWQRLRDLSERYGAGSD